MSEQYPALVVIGPLLCALLVSVAGWLRPRLCLPLALLGLGIAAASSTGLLVQVLAHGPVTYRLGGWDPPWGIVYYVDNLNAVVAALVSWVALVNLAASYRAVMTDYPQKIGPFYTLYVLAVTGMLGMVVTGDAFNLYVLLEITSLTGYALIGLGGGRAPLASLNYLFLGTIGASFYLLGVGYLYIVTGSLNMADLAKLLTPLYGSLALLAAFAITLVGLWMKMAFFPLHAWLPNAYGFAPSPAASLLAPLMTKVMVYVMIRVMLSVFTVEFILSEVVLSQFVVWLAVAAMVAGALLALGQRDLKRMLAYIVVAEVGYMVGGAWLGNKLAMTGAILHIINDAVMTFCVFLAAGCIFQKTRGTAFEDLQGLFKKMPWTMTALAAGALAMIGVPPFCGFFSKWYLIRGGLEAGHWGFVAALLFSSLVNVVLFFRIFEIAFFEPMAEGHGHGGHGGHGEHGGAVALAEAPLSMLLPLLAAALGLIVLGLATGPLVEKIILPIIPTGLG
ncbi:MAG: monovalent cation/H+ antiporter subunit D family protein [Deltaproteobacteria bacterium]|nr:monovalent cation/H+ antiporter subunit D family protein [Deltaproteobacteria bacterium]